MNQTLQHLMTMVEEATSELVELHQALVRAPTVNTGALDSGNEIQVCCLLKERFNAEHIPCLILESAPSRGNLLAYVGSQPRPRLLLMSHTDVVPVEDESCWKLPPFSGQLVDGKVYGRGSHDCKSLVASGAMAVILLKRAGIRLRGELRFLAAADEEAGGKYGSAWLATTYPEEIRADWAINEGGGMPLKTPRGLAYLISVGEKGRMEAKFNIRGQSGHAASPWTADNTLYKLAQLLIRLQNYQPDIDVTMSIFQHMHFLGIEETPTRENLDRILAEVKKSDRSLATKLMGHSRMSIVPTMVSAGIKSNSIPAVAGLSCDIRTLAHQDKAYVRRELEEIMKGIDGVSVELDVTASANASPFDSPFVAQLQCATALALGQEDIIWIPSLTVGFTDSRCIRPLGTQVYGFAPLTPDSDTVRPGVHGVDEVSEIDNLILRTKMQVALAYLALDGQRDRSCPAG
jgi:acetylornithine deacetylase/succinyl-diaminopimelate desuccinylase-like protein